MIWVVQVSRRINVAAQSGSANFDHRDISWRMAPYDWQKSWRWEQS